MKKRKARAQVLLCTMLLLLSGCAEQQQPEPAEEQPVSYTALERPIELKDDSVLEEPLYEEKETQPDTVVLNFAGDFMIASFQGVVQPNNFAETALKKEKTYFLEKVAPIFAEDDFTIVNLENVLTDDENLLPKEKDHSPAYWYRGPSENTEILTSSSIEVVSLSNNHTGDYGEKGKNDTIAACEAAGILYGSNDKTLYLEKNGIRIALICCGLWNAQQVHQILPRIEDAEERSDVQLIYYHGGTERVHQPENWRVEASHLLADSGADLVVGNHPHVLQGMELYNGVPIYYSLGNFLFGGGWTCENRTIILTCTLQRNGEDGISISTEEIPCYVYGGARNNWQPNIIQDEKEREKVLSFIHGEEDTPL